MRASDLNLGSGPPSRQRQAAVDELKSVLAQPSFEWASNQLREIGERLQGGDSLWGFAIFGEIKMDSELRSIHEQLLTMEGGSAFAARYPDSQALKDRDEKAYKNRAATIMPDTARRAYRKDINNGRGPFCPDEGLDRPTPRALKAVRYSAAGGQDMLLYSATPPAIN